MNFIIKDIVKWEHNFEPEFIEISFRDKKKLVLSDLEKEKFLKVKISEF